MQVAKVSAVVTGAGRGLGLAFSRAILEHGGSVFMTDVDLLQLQYEGDKLRAQFPSRVAFDKQDVTDLDSFEAAFDAANRSFPSHPVNVLVNNAGVGTGNFYTDLTTEHWTNAVAINATAVIRGTQVALHRLSRDRGQPVVVNVASMAGLFPIYESPVYSATKAAVVSFTKATGLAVDKTNMRVTGLCPGFTDTQMGKRAEAAFPDTVKYVGGLMPVEYVAEGLVRVLNDADNSGDVLVISPRGMQYLGLEVPEV